MSHDEFDDGLVHGHDWAIAGSDRPAMPIVADASSVKTPSSVFHDDLHQAE